VIRALGYLLSEALWALLFRLVPPQHWEDEDPQSTAEATAVRNRWIEDHRPKEDGS